MEWRKLIETVCTLFLSWYYIALKCTLGHFKEDDAYLMEEIYLFKARVANQSKFASVKT